MPFCISRVVLTQMGTGLWHIITHPSWRRRRLGGYHHLFLAFFLFPPRDRSQLYTIYGSYARSSLCILDFCLVHFCVCRPRAGLLTQRSWRSISWTVSIARFQDRPRYSSCHSVLQERGALGEGKGPCPPAPSLVSFLCGFSSGEFAWAGPIQSIVAYPSLRDMAVCLSGEAAGA